MASVSGVHMARNNPMYTNQKNMANHKAYANNPELRDKMRMLSKPEAQNMPTGNTLLQSVQGYGAQIRAQRESAQATALKVKKLKYKFKDISSKLISSKTSHAAKQVAGQAKRELLRLKREKLKSEENDPELDAAIAHAKSMERIAKKKAKNLEEEERVKVKDGAHSDVIEREEKIEDAKDLTKMDELEESAEELEDAELEELKEAFEEQMSELTSELADEMEELTSEMSDEMSAMMDEIRDLTDEMNMDDLLLMEVAPGEEMDPEDLKELKIKHRNKEMKEIVKADMEYLKAVFDSMDKSKSIAAVPASPGANISMATPASMVAPISADVSAPQPVIDISL